MGRALGPLWQRADELAEQVRAVALAQTCPGDERHEAIQTRWPVDVFAIASALGVAVDDHADIAEDGLLLPGAHSWQVLIRRNTPEARARFTLAHELMHLAIRTPGVGGQAARDAVDTIGGFRSEERLCDVAAASLLLPDAETLHADEQARHDVGDGQCARTVHVATQGKASLAATFVRLHGLHGWRTMLYRWTRGRRSWFAQCEAGLNRSGTPPVFGDALESTINTASAHLVNPSVQTIWLPVAGPRQDRWVSAAAIVGASAVTAVIDPSAPARAQPPTHFLMPRVTATRPARDPLHHVMT